MLINVKGEIDSNTIVVGEFNTPLTSMDRRSRKKETLALNDTLDQMNLIDKIEHSVQKQQSIYAFKCYLLRDRSHGKPQNKAQ